MEFKDFTGEPSRLTKSSRPPANHPWAGAGWAELRSGRRRTLARRAFGAVVPILDFFELVERSRAELDTIEAPDEPGGIDVVPDERQGRG